MPMFPDIELEDFDEHSLADEPDFDDDDSSPDDLEIEVEPEND